MTDSNIKSPSEIFKIFQMCQYFINCEHEESQSIYLETPLLSNSIGKFSVICAVTQKFFYYNGT